VLIENTSLHAVAQGLCRDRHNAPAEEPGSVCDSLGCIIQTTACAGHTQAAITDFICALPCRGVCTHLAVRYGNPIKGSLQPPCQSFNEQGTGPSLLKVRSDRLADRPAVDSSIVRTLASARKPTDSTGWACSCKHIRSRSGCDEKLALTDHAKMCVRGVSELLQPFDRDGWVGKFASPNRRMQCQFSQCFDEVAEIPGLREIAASDSEHQGIAPGSIQVGRNPWIKQFRWESQVGASAVEPSHERPTSASRPEPRRRGQREHPQRPCRRRIRVRNQEVSGLQLAGDREPWERVGSPAIRPSPADRRGLGRR